MPSIPRKAPQRISPYWKEWLKMIRAIRKARRTIAKGFSPHGPRWTHGMLRYYDERLEMLTESEPEKYVD